MWQPWQIVHLTSVSSKNKRAFDNFILSDIRWDLGFYITQTLSKFFPIKGKKNQNPFIRWEYFNPSSKLQPFSGRQDVTVVHTRNDTAKKPAKQRQNLPYFCHSDKDTHPNCEVLGVLSFHGWFSLLLIVNEAWIRTILSPIRPESWDLKLINIEEETIKSQRHENYWKKK